MLVIHDLGEFIAERDAQRLEPGGAEPRTTLALLCAAAGRPTASDTLITEVWGPYAFEQARRALESKVWRLRIALFPPASARRS